MEDLKNFSQEISFSDSDFYNDRLIPFAVLKKFQDIATSHAEKLGIGFDAMSQKNILWITMRLKFKVLGKIVPNTTLTIYTYPQQKNVLEFDRDFVIVDKISGKKLIIGTSKWCLIDKTTRRLSKMSNIDYPFEFNNKPVFEGKFLKTESFEPTDKPVLIYQVEEGDIDSNGHMNNTIYSKLIMNALSNSFNQIDIFQINFLGEALLGDTIEVFTKTENGNILALGKFPNGKQCFTAFVSFQN